MRGAATETLLPSVANSRFQVTGLEPGLVGIMLARDGAIDGFVNSSNRMFLNYRPTNSISRDRGNALDTRPAARKVTHP
jgi:hypothetical protein